MKTNLRTNYVIIPHPLTRELLVTVTDEGWCLPVIHIEATRGWWRETSLINQVVLDQHHLDVITLRCIEIYSRESEKSRIGVFVAEIRDLSGKVSEEMSWLGQEQLKNLKCSQERHQAVIDDWFGSEEVVSQPAWTQPGWFNRAESWIHQQAAVHGFTAIRPVEQVRSQNYTSCILRVLTAEGELYFKASATHYSYEPLLTQVLAQQYPDVLPEVIAIERTEHWMLMRGFDGYELNRLHSIEAYLLAWESVLGRFAQIQHDYIPQTQALLNFGCLDWRLEKLADSIEPWMQELDESSVIEVGYFNKEVKAIREIMPKLKSLCVELENYCLPPTIHHGDFHSGNLLTNGTTNRVLDWAFQTGVTHPFFFMAVVFGEIEDVAMQTRLRDYYLQFWINYEPMERLLKAFELSQPLAVLHGVLGHYVQMSHASTIWESKQEAQRIKYYLNDVVRRVSRL